MKLFICDYQIPRSEELDCLIVEAEEYDMAEKLVIDELKLLNIPKRYILKIEEV